MALTPKMALTRAATFQDREDREDRAAALPTPAAAVRQRSRGSAPARSYAALAPTVELALRAVRLEALLSDPFDDSNPYGFRALARGRAGTGSGAGSAADDHGAALLGELVRAELVPAAEGGEFTSAEQLVRVVRPLLRRDLALGHAYAVRGLLTALEEGAPVPPGADGLAALLAPAALVAAAGTCLRAAVRAVADGAAGDPAARQRQAPLAAAFADLLACESLLSVGLRASALPQGCGPAVRAAAGYVVPIVVGDVLGELDLVLRDCGADAGGPQRGTLAKLVADLPRAGAGGSDIAARQVELVRELPALAAAFTRRGDAAGSGALLRLGEDMPVRSMPPAPGSDDTLVAALTAARTRLARAAAVGAGAGSGAGAGDAQDDPAGAALARVAGRLLSEQRALLRASRAAEEADPRDPAVRAVADRQAFLLLAGAVLGVQGAADDGRGLFLGGPHWALLATLRITERLGIAPEGPGGPATVGAQRRIWAELDARDRRGVDCDVYATRVLW